MNLESMKCPECGAPLHFDNANQEFCFCSHCGAQVYKENNKWNDEMELKRLKADYERRKLELDAEEDKRLGPWVIALLFFMFAGLIIFYILALI
jgi:hypothetical protein